MTEIMTRYENPDCTCIEDPFDLRPTKACPVPGHLPTSCGVCGKPETYPGTVFDDEQSIYRHETC